MKEISIQTLRNSEHLKPPGYLAACLSIGKVIGDTLSLTNDDFQSIRDRFQVVASKITGDCGCGGHTQLECGFRAAPATCKDKPSCSLGFYGGAPKICECQKCIAAGENTEEYARKLEALHAMSHPPDRQQVSGCCDSALNPPL